MPPKPVVSVGDPSDSGENQARYEELTGKARLLYGQHHKLVDEIIPLLDAVVEDLKLTWTGERSTKFQAEWANKRAELQEWAGRIARAHNRLNDEANNYKS